MEDNSTQLSPHKPQRPHSQYPGRVLSRSRFIGLHDVSNGVVLNIQNFVEKEKAELKILEARIVCERERLAVRPDLMRQHDRSKSIPQAMDLCGDKIGRNSTDKSPGSPCQKPSSDKCSRTSDLVWICEESVRGPFDTPNSGACSSNADQLDQRHLLIPSSPAKASPNFYGSDAQKHNTDLSTSPKQAKIMDPSSSSVSPRLKSFLNWSIFAQNMLAHRCGWNFFRPKKINMDKKLSGISSTFWFQEKSSSTKIRSVRDNTLSKSAQCHQEAQYFRSCLRERMIRSSVLFSSVASLMKIGIAKRSDSVSEECHLYNVECFTKYSQRMAWRMKVSGLAAGMQFLRLTRTGVRISGLKLLHRAKVAWEEYVFRSRRTLSVLERRERQTKHGSFLAWILYTKNPFPSQTTSTSRELEPLNFDFGFLNSFGCRVRVALSMNLRLQLLLMKLMNKKISALSKQVFARWSRRGYSEPNVVAAMRSSMHSRRWQITASLSALHRWGRHAFQIVQARLRLAKVAVGWKKYFVLRLLSYWTSIALLRSTQLQISHAATKRLMKQSMEKWLGTFVLPSTHEQCCSDRLGVYFKKLINNGWAQYRRKMALYSACCSLRRDMYLNSLSRFFCAWSVIVVLHERMCLQQQRVAEFCLCFRLKAKCVQNWSKLVIQRNHLMLRNKQATSVLQNRQKAVLFRSFKCLLPKFCKEIGVLSKASHEHHYSSYFKSIRFALNGWEDMMKKKKWVLNLYIRFQQRRLMSLVRKSFHFLYANPHTMFKVYRFSYICSQTALRTKCTSRRALNIWISCLITDNSEVPASYMHSYGKLVRYARRRACTSCAEYDTLIRFAGKLLRKFYCQLRSLRMKEYLKKESKHWRLRRYCELITSWRERRAISCLFCGWKSIHLNAVTMAQRTNVVETKESKAPSQMLQNALLRSACVSWATACFRKLHAQMLCVKISARSMHTLIRHSFTGWILAVYAWRKKEKNLQDEILCLRRLRNILRGWVQQFIQMKERKLIHSELIKRTRHYVLRQQMHAWNSVALCQPFVRLICHRDLFFANAHFSSKCKARLVKKWSEHVSQRGRLSLIEKHTVLMQQKNLLVHIFCVWSDFRQQVISLPEPGKLEYSTLAHGDNLIKTQFCSGDCGTSTVVINSRFYSIKLGCVRLRFHTWRVTTSLVHTISISHSWKWKLMVQDFFLFHWKRVLVLVLRKWKLLSTLRSDFRVTFTLIFQAVLAESYFIKWSKKVSKNYTDPTDSNFSDKICPSLSERLQVGGNSESFKTTKINSISVQTEWHYHHVSSQAVFDQYNSDIQQSRDNLDLKEISSDEVAVQHVEVVNESWCNSECSLFLPKNFLLYIEKRKRQNIFKRNFRAWVNTVDHKKNSNECVRHILESNWRINVIGFMRSWHALTSLKLDFRSTVKHAYFGSVLRIYFCRWMAFDCHEHSRLRNILVSRLWFRYSTGIAKRKMKLIYLVMVWKIKKSLAMKFRLKLRQIFSHNIIRAYLSEWILLAATNFTCRGKKSSNGAILQAKEINTTPLKFDLNIQYPASPASLSLETQSSAVNTTDKCTLELHSPVVNKKDKGKLIPVSMVENGPQAEGRNPSLPEPQAEKDSLCLTLDSAMPVSPKYEQRYFRFWSLFSNNEKILRSFFTRNLRRCQNRLTRSLFLTWQANTSFGLDFKSTFKCTFLNMLKNKFLVAWSHVAVGKCHLMSVDCNATPLKQNLRLQYPEACSPSWHVSKQQLLDTNVASGMAIVPLDSDDMNRIFLQPFESDTTPLKLSLSVQYPSG